MVALPTPDLPIATTQAVSFILPSLQISCPFLSSEDSMSESKQNNLHILRYQEWSASQSLTSFSKKYFIFMLHLFLFSILINERGGHMTTDFMIDLPDGACRHAVSNTTLAVSRGPGRTRMEGCRFAQ